MRKTIPLLTAFSFAANILIPSAATGQSETPPSPLYEGIKACMTMLNRNSGQVAGAVIKTEYGNILCDRILDEGVTTCHLRLPGRDPSIIHIHSLFAYPLTVKGYSKTYVPPELIKELTDINIYRRYRVSDFVANVQFETNEPENLVSEPLFGDFTLTPEQKRQAMKYLRWGKEFTSQCNAARM